MSINLKVPRLSDLKPRLTVVGVGGAGGNAVNNMIAAGLSGVQFIVANTDAQALAASSAERRIQLGLNITEGLGAGSKPEIGQAAAEEATDEIRAHLEGAHMVFIAAGMGGGTGTGAASVVARVAHELGILTVAIVTKPFQFEGSRRMRLADQGIGELRKYVDTLIVIPNQNLFRIANERTTFSEAFVLADQVLFSGIACIVDLIVKEGLINLDFADVRTILSGMGSAMMGTGEASGERRAVAAAEEAITNPLLDDVSLKGAKGLLLSIIGGRDLTLYEVDEAASRIRQEVDRDANIIVGASFDDSMGDRLRVAIVASGMAGVTASRSPMPGTAMNPGQPRAGAESPLGPILPPANDDVGSRPPLPAFATSPSPPPLHPGSPPSPLRGSDSRPAWVAPGGVRIEEGPFSAAPAAAQHGDRSMSPSSPTEAFPPTTFTPGPPPADIRRTQPRMPEIQDFPAVGQREYQARSQGSQTPPRAHEPAPQPPAQATRRYSLLQLLRLRRGDDESEAGREGEDRSPMPTFLKRDKR
jgi:cell division protein FtsZ